MKNQTPNINLTMANGAVELEAYIQARLGGQVRDFRL